MPVDRKNTPHEIPVLSLWQPWAQLIVAGRKTIETRSWSTKYRGPLAIQAGKVKAHYTDPVYQHCSTNGLLDDDIKPLVFGAIVAVVDLVDVVPMVAAGSVVDRCILADQGEAWGWKLVPSHVEGVPWNNWSDLRSQVPFGVYAPGRFAWLLDNVRPLATPLPFKGGQGLTRKVALDAVSA